MSRPADGAGVSRRDAKQWLRLLGRGSDIRSITRTQADDERRLLAFDYAYANWSRREGYDQDDAKT